MTYVTPRISGASPPQESSPLWWDAPADGADALTVPAWDSPESVSVCTQGHHVRVYATMCVRARGAGRSGRSEGEGSGRLR